MPEDTTIDAIRSDFIEKVGMITQGEGLPRIAGRIFGMLMFDGDVMSFSELSTRLQVSRASISTSVRLLEERGLLKRITKPGERQDFFQLAPNPYATMLEVTLKRTRSTRDELTNTINSLPADTGAAQRLSDYARFYESINSGLCMALENLADTKVSPAGQGPEGSKDVHYEK